MSVAVSLDDQVLAALEASLVDDHELRKRKAVGFLLALGWERSRALAHWEDLVSRGLSSGASLSHAVATAYSFCVPQVPDEAYVKYRSLVFAGIDPFDAAFEASAS